MEMGMVLQVLPPSVKHGEKTGLGSQVFRVGRDFEQRLRCGPEQDSIHHALVLQSQRREQLRQREHHVKVRYRQQVRHAVGEPLLASCALAFRAMPIQAGVIGDDAMGTLIALLDVTAENRRSTVFDGVEDAEMDQVQ
jgi:hypothetical protein